LIRLFADERRERDDVVDHGIQPLVGEILIGFGERAVLHDLTELSARRLEHSGG
jgi:hypothetical protein